MGKFRVTWLGAGDPDPCCSKREWERKEAQNFVA